MVLRAINVCVNHAYLYVANETYVSGSVCVGNMCQLQMICVSVMKRACARESVCDTRELVSK